MSTRPRVTLGHRAGLAAAAFALAIAMLGTTLPTPLYGLYREQFGLTFIQAALAAFAGYAVLGLFTAVAPAFLAEELGVTNLAVVGLVVFAVFAASMVGQLMLTLLPQPAALPAGCLALIAGMGWLALGLALSSLALLVLGGVIAGFGQGMAFRAGLSLPWTPTARVELAPAAAINTPT